MFRKKIDHIALVTQIANEGKINMKKRGIEVDFFPDILFREMISDVLNHFRDDRIIKLNKSEKKVIETLDQAISDDNTYFGSLLKLVKKCIFSIKPDGLGWWNIFNSDVGPLAKSLNDVRCYYRFEPELLCDIILQNYAKRELILNHLLKVKNEIDFQEHIDEEQLINYVRKTDNEILARQNNKKTAISNILSEYKNKNPTMQRERNDKADLKLNDREKNLNDAYYSSFNNGISV